ncbi:MAG TPA: WXG100 family type VII secretion target [Actinoplanes sp.]|nr:WXG100 family type VII secretion target [Actinoplanes sp.]
MASYALNANGLLDTSAELSGITRSIQTTIDDLNGAVAVYIGANSGDAQQAFVNAQAEWNNGIDLMRQALAQAQGRLDQIHDSYRLGDVKGAALFGGSV